MKKLHGNSLMYLFADGHVKPYGMDGLYSSMKKRNYWRSALWPEEGLRFNRDGSDPAPPRASPFTQFWD